MNNIVEHNELVTRLEGQARKASQTDKRKERHFLNQINEKSSRMTYDPCDDNTHFIPADIQKYKLSDFWSNLKEKNCDHGLGI